MIGASCKGSMPSSAIAALASYSTRSVLPELYEISHFPMAGTFSFFRNGSEQVGAGVFALKLRSLATMKYYNAPEWEKKRETILRDRGRKCEGCGADATQVHHKWYTVGKKPWEYPSFAFEALCRSCHMNRHTSVIP